MRFFFKKIIFCFSLVTAFSCSSNKQSPFVYFANVTPNSIVKVECNWNKTRLQLARLNPGDTRGQSFPLKNSSDFFGEVNVFYENLDGRIFNRTFNFSKAMLRSMNEKYSSYVQVYIKEDDIEILTSDSPNLDGRSKGIEDAMKAYREQYSKSVGFVGNPCTIPRVPCLKVVETSLIRIDN